MELILAKEAYANTLLAQVKAKRDLFSKFMLSFNKFVTNTYSRGESTFVLRWKDFDKTEELATNEDLLGEILNYVILAGYDVEFCYNGPSAYNPCGIIVAWGAEAEKDITVMFDSLDGVLWRGE